MDEELTKEENKLFYEWLDQFISYKEYEEYYNPIDGGCYKIITTNNDVFYQGTYEYNNWIKDKIKLYKNNK